MMRVNELAYAGIKQMIAYVSVIKGCVCVRCYIISTIYTIIDDFKINGYGFIVIYVIYIAAVP